MSRAIAWRFTRKYEKGEQPRKTKCLGYDYNDNGKLIINIVEAEIIKLIFNEYLNGNTAYGIAKLLHDNNVLTVRGGTVWHRSSILFILKNEVYTGNLLIPKTMKKEFDDLTWRPINGRKNQYLVEKNHEPIISTELFQKVQEIIFDRNDNTDHKKGLVKRKYSTKNPLSNILICKECGSSFRRVIRKRKGVRIPCWVCAIHAETSVKKCANYMVYTETEIFKILNIENQNEIEKDQVIVEL